MPKRTNFFQELVSLIEKSLLDRQATVTDSKFLKCSSGNLVEVDLVIESSQERKFECISIEASKKGRKATVDWVNGMFGKHYTLPTTKLVLVCSLGYSKAASRKAALLSKYLKIELITLTEAAKLDWLPIPHKIPYINVDSFLLPILKNVTLVFDEKNKNDVPTGDYSSLVVYDQAGKEHGNAIDILRRDILSKPSVLKTLQEKSFTDSGTLVEVEYPLKKGMYVVDKRNKKVPLYKIRAQATCKRELSSLDLTKFTYGKQIGVMHGVGKTFKRPISTVVTQKQSGRVSVALGIKKSISNI